MLELQEKFKIEVFNRYGEEGNTWLNNLETIIAKYIKKFDLYDVKLIKNLSINIVLFAKSHQFGNIVMKIGTPGQTSINEIKIMKYYSSDHTPKCYYSSIKDRIMLLEQLSPGYSLDNLKNIKERVEVFSNLANHLLIPANKKENFHTFEDIFVQKLQYAYKNKVIFSDIFEMLDIAQSLYEKIKDLNLPKYILHYDLHHKNILKSENSWKAIDPHGIIGERVFETSQFIRAEIEKIELEEDNIDKIINLVSHYFKEDKKLILEALYCYVTEKIIFYIINKSDAHIISYNIDVCKKILNLLQKAA